MYCFLSNLRENLLSSDILETMYTLIKTDQLELKNNWWLRAMNLGQLIRSYAWLTD